MSQIIDGVFSHSASNSKAMGGTEILGHQLIQFVDKEDLKGVQIILSRVEHELSPNHVRIFWAHDLPSDPASEFLKDKGERAKFHKFIFVSNWQMQQYINYFNLPWKDCIVMQNAIVPIPAHEKPKDKFNIIYFSTPHRGLEILVPVVARITEKRKGKDVHLHVYSSFDLYGWPQRDEPYKALFKTIDDHPHMTNHGAVPNQEIRKALQDSHIFAYPSIWQETSCLCLMESMSAGLVCVHNNYGALAETAANWTAMYQQQEDPRMQMSYMYSLITQAIDHYSTAACQNELASMMKYANIYYSWGKRKQEWESFLRVLKGDIKDTKLPQQMFTYSS